MTMKIGLLWYDADAKKPMQTKIDEAAERYIEKHQLMPNLCYLHPSQVTVHSNLRVEASAYVQPNYIMVGVEEGTEAVSIQVDKVPIVLKRRSA